MTNNEVKKHLYIEIADIIMDEIISGKYEIGSVFTSERRLMIKYNVSRFTIRQAIDRLEDLGYLKSEHGRGTFVHLPNFKTELGGFFSFTHIMRKQNKEVTTKVLQLRIINNDVEKQTKFNNDKILYKIVRLRMLDGKKVLLETNYLPYFRFEGLTKKDLESSSLHEIITIWYRTPLTKAEEIFQLIRLNDENAPYLDGKSGEIALSKERYSYYNDELVCYTKSISVDEELTYKVLVKSE